MGKFSCFSFFDFIAFLAVSSAFNTVHLVLTITVFLLPCPLIFLRGLWLLRGTQAPIQEAGRQYLPRRPRGEEIKWHFCL